MPKGSKGQKRPTNKMGNGVEFMRFATGEEEENFPAHDGKDKAAQSLGRRGGKARARALGPKQRKDIARAAANARWKR